jgi:hypothetical protein
MKNEVILDEEECNEATAVLDNDYGMDCLARSLGLDIEANAVKLALQIDNCPPTLCRPIVPTS